MKNLFVATILLVSPSAFAACPNFAGVYTYVDPTAAAGTVPTTLTVVQNQCATAEFDYQTGPNSDILGKVYTADGVRRETSATATTDVYETASWNGTALQNTALQNMVEFYDVASKTTITAISEFYLDANGNLVGTDNYYDADGKNYYSDTHNYTRNP